MFVVDILPMNGKMDYRIVPLLMQFVAIRIADVSLQKSNPGVAGEFRNLVRISREQGQLMAAVKQLQDEMRPNITCATGNEYSHGSTSIRRLFRLEQNPI